MDYMVDVYKPVCPKCGNTKKFLHRTIEWEVCYYDDAGNINDSKSQEVESSRPVMCAECHADMDGE